MRKVRIDNKELIPLLEEKSKIHEETTKIMEDLMVLDKERTKKSYRMQALKDKIEAITNTIDIDMDEFEVKTRIFLTEEGVPNFEIADLIEEYKKSFREERDKKDEETKKEVS